MLMRAARVTSELSPMGSIPWDQCSCLLQNAAKLQQTEMQTFLYLYIKEHQK